MKTGVVQLRARQFVNAVTPSNSQALSRTLTFWLHNGDFTDTDKQCEASYHSTEHSNAEEEEEHDKETGGGQKRWRVCRQSHRPEGTAHCSPARHTEKKATWAASI